MLRRLLLPALILVAAPAAAQDFPKLSGRVVDAAGIIPDADEAALTQKLAAVEQASSRQLVVATVSSLEGRDIADYGYRLGRAWGIGQSEANNGIILLVAPNERKVRIEVGYGLEPIMTDALSSVIVNTQIVPRFKAGDYPGGIAAGADAIIEQLRAPPEQAEQRALEAARQHESRRASSGGGGGMSMIIFWVILFFFVLPMLRRGRRGRRHRGGVFLWGPGLGGGWGGGSSGGGFGGFGGRGGGGFGGFSGGGGSFGGGGASGGW